MLIFTIFSFLDLIANLNGAPCPLDFVAYKRQGCFFFQGYEYDAITYDEAKIACISKQGSILASIDDAEQETWLLNDNMWKNESYGSHTVWIGLIRASTANSQFKWMDNNTSPYRNWLPSEPNNWQTIEDCTQILVRYNYQGITSYGWNDAVCEYTPGFSGVHQRAYGYFCRLPYNDQADVEVDNGQQKSLTSDPGVFSTNVGLAVTVVFLLLAILSVIGYGVWTYRRMILAKLPYLTTKSASTEDLKSDHDHE